MLKIKHLSNIELLHELPFSEEINFAQISRTFKGYAKSYKIKIISLKEFLAQLEALKFCLNTF